MQIFKLLVSMSAAVGVGAVELPIKPAPNPVGGDAGSLTQSSMRTVGNNTLFTRWRPRSHFLAPAGWMNDPCGAVYDPKTNWKDDSSVSLASGRYKSAPLSVFSGSAQAVNLEGKQDGTLLNFATGINALPTNWVKPYINNTEVQVVFISTDSGKTWTDGGLIISGPPPGWNVTGFRDPYVFQNPELDALRGSEPSFYLTLGSGVRGPNVPAKFETAARPGYLRPRIPLYAASATDLKKWTFLGALWETAPNISLGDPDVTGSFGFNFETSGLFNIPINANATAKKQNAWFTLMGTEGGQTARHPNDHWALWSRGVVTAAKDGVVNIKPSSSGAVDWGISYAHTSFIDARKENNNRRVMWGWANEDIDANFRHPVLKGFGNAGAMNLPVELFLKSTPHVQKHNYVDGNEWVAGAKGAYTAQTLGMRPLPDVMKLLTTGAKQETYTVGNLAAGSAPKNASPNLGDSYVLTATLGPTQGAAGIRIAHSPDNAEYTDIVYDAKAKTISVLRAHSSSLQGFFATGTHEGHFAPYTSANGTVEDITFTIVLDKSLLEVFVNDRFTLTSRIYPTRADSTGVSFITDKTNAALWKQVTAFKGLAKAWPKRLLRSRYRGNLFLW